MGILSNEEAIQLEKQFEREAMLFVPLMKLENNIIWMDKLKNIIYYLEEGFDFNKCFKHQTKEEFMEITDSLKKQGWEVIK